MRNNLVIGTVLVCVGGLLVPVLMLMGMTHRFAAIIGTLTAISGFILQMGWAFNQLFSSKRRECQRQQEHEEIMAKAKKLPPEQAIELLLNSIKD